MHCNNIVISELFNKDIYLTQVHTSKIVYCIIINKKQQDNIFTKQYYGHWYYIEIIILFN